MTSDKTQHARCIIENYKNELTDSKKRHFSVYNRHFTDDIRKCYCFPNLYSALFYDPTPEHIDYIGREAYDILIRNGYLLAEENLSGLYGGEVESHMQVRCAGAALHVEDLHGVF